MPKFEPINYRALNARQKELFNFHKAAATFADFGFNCIKLDDDWQGADFLADHISGTKTLRVQLKSRVTIEKKYDKNIWITFPHKDFWYLIKHDELIAKVRQHTDWLQSRSWQEQGIYHSASINPELLNSLVKHKLGPVYGVVLDTQALSAKSANA